MSDSPLSGVIGGGKGPGKKAAASKKEAAKKAPAAKKAAAPKGDGDKIVRSASTVSKEGTMKDTFTGEVLPVTAFPTYKDKDGVTQRRTVARKNEKAYREQNKKDREAKRAAAEKVKADNKAAAAKAKADKAAAAKESAES